MTASVACRMYGDCWDGVLNDEWHVERASAADFEKAILRLDAQRYTMITIAGDCEKHLAIGGGDGQYVVYATFNNHEFWNLMRSDVTRGTVLLKAGGQEGDFPAEQVVGLQQACGAGLVFLDSGQLDPCQRWERQ